MRMFFIILGLMLVLDLAWWFYADRLLRPTRRRRLWRTLLAVFMTLQVLLLIWTCSARRFGPRSDHMTPKLFLSAAHLCHLFILPILLVLWIAFGVVPTPFRLVRWLRREKVEHPAHHVSPREAVAAAADLALE